MARVLTEEQASQFASRRGTKGKSSVNMDESWFTGDWVLLSSDPTEADREDGLPDFIGDCSNARSSVQGSYTRRGEPNPQPGYEGKVLQMETRTIDDTSFALRTIEHSVDSPEGAELLRSRSRMSDNLQARKASKVTVTTTTTIEEDDSEDEDEG